MRVVAVDPGGTSGIAVYDSNATPTFESFELPTFPALDTVHNMLQSPSPPALLVVESFHLNAGTLRKTRGGSHAAIESIGALRHLAWHYGVPFKAQEPNAKDFADNAKLKMLGWRNPSSGGHADDAARHLVVALLEAGVLDAGMFVEPEPIDVA